MNLGIKGKGPRLKRKKKKNSRGGPRDKTQEEGQGPHYAGRERKGGNLKFTLITHGKI